MKASTFAGGRALVVAVANYDAINSLPNVVLNDARDVSGVLSSPHYCGYDPLRVTTLLDKAASVAAIRKALATLASISREGDTVVVYFSGHGMRLNQRGEDISLLLPVDFRRNDPLRTGLSATEFSQTLAAIPARRLLVVLDACHSGGAGSLKEEGGSPGGEGFTDKDLQELAQGVGRVIMASSRSTETSLVLHGARNSLFTERFLEALHGAARTNGDGLIRVFEVFNYVAEKVRESAPGRQHPIFKASDLEDNFPIALDRGGTKSPLTPETHPAAPRPLEEILSDLYPAGPQDDEIWARAGGDISRLRLNGSGQAIWFSAVRTLRQGGGGSNITIETLIKAALGDFPHHPELQAVSVSNRS